MSHLVLYRSFRPKTFDEVIGQEHIVKTLKNQVANNSFGHAYLFCGTRGTGKTSCAKIFARAVNCLSPVDGSPCGKCANCLSNQGAENLDIIEIDAASNNRVDEIRDLREKIGYLPSVNKYKVYIVDEVHMLTDSAFNALLKTLEEPPSHAIFILATTEPHKLPATILSRCMRFDFKLVSEQDLILHLKNIFEKSGIKCDNESLKLIASSGKGSVRDTLSVAEMCAAFCNNDIKYNNCLECLGITDSQTIINILSALASSNAKDILTISNNLSNQGKNFSVLVNDLIEAINNLLTIKLTENANEILSLPQEVFDDLKTLSAQVDANRMLEWLKVLTELDGKLKLSSNVFLLVESALLSMIYSSSELENLKAKVSELEKKTVNENFSVNLIENQKQEKIVEQPKEEQTIAQNFETKQNQMDSKKIFGEILLNIRKENNMLLYSILADVDDVFVENGNLILASNEITIEALEKEKTSLIEQTKKYGLGLQLTCKQKKQEKTTEEYLKEKFGDKITIE